MESAFIDTCVLAAYLFREEKRFEKAKNALRSAQRLGVSVITIHELHYLALKLGVEDAFKEAKNLIDRAFKVHELTQEACMLASELRSSHRLPEVDALILSTAIANNYEAFYSFDSDFKPLHGSKIRNTKIHYLTP